MNKYLTEKENEEFIKYLTKHNLHSAKLLATRFYVTTTKVSSSIPKFSRKTIKKLNSNAKTPRIWKDLIVAQIENVELKEILRKMKEAIK